MHDTIKLSKVIRNKGVDCMSEVMNNIKTRRAVRKYKADMVPRNVIEKIVEAGTYAPTGRNLQSPIIIAVTDKAMRDRMSKLNAKVAETSTDPFYGAPVVLVVLADKSKPCYQYDGTLVMGNLMLAAHDLGVGSCWIQIHLRKSKLGKSSEDLVRDILGIDDYFRIVGILALGIEDGHMEAYSLDDIDKEKVHYLR
jgi:nitroreductase